MKILIPPSKEMEIGKIEIGKQGDFTDNTKFIVHELLDKSHDELMKIYKKDQLANNNARIFQRIATGDEQENMAIYYFNGLMYRCLEPVRLSCDELSYIQENLRIISPLYGVIKPKDRVAFHRLDFSVNFSLSDGRKLVEYWKDKISEYLLKEDDIFINLLSQEFEKVLTKEIIDKSIRIKFYEEDNGKLKTHSTVSKKARGFIVREMAINNVNTIEELKKLKPMGFIYNEQHSSDKELVYVGKSICVRKHKENV